MKHLKKLVFVAMTASSFALWAQTPIAGTSTTSAVGGMPSAEHREAMRAKCDADPKACEEKRKEMHDKMKAKCDADPQACEAKRKEMQEKRKERREEMKARCDADPQACEAKRKEMKERHGQQKPNGAAGATPAGATGAVAPKSL